MITLIGFLKSKEFWATTIFLAVMFLTGRSGDLANIIQDFGIYGWAYVIWKMEKHHTIVKSFFEEDDEE
jgi:hypothetical protein